MKSHGKLFVKGQWIHDLSPVLCSLQQLAVLKLTGLTVPIPPQPTIFSLTLNNGIHFVTTPECRFGREARIEQEFEL